MFDLSVLSERMRAELCEVLKSLPAPEPLPPEEQTAKDAAELVHLRAAMYSVHFDKSVLNPDIWRDVDEGMRARFGDDWETRDLASVPQSMNEMRQETLMSEPVTIRWLLWDAVRISADDLRTAARCLRAGAYRWAWCSLADAFSFRRRFKRAAYLYRVSRTHRKTDDLDTGGDEEQN